MENPALKDVDAIAWAIQERAVTHRKHISFRTANGWAKAVLKSASKHTVPVAVIMAVIETESSWAIGAVSPKACQGLMQLHPETAAALAQALGIRNLDLHNPEHSIRIGTAYLGQLYRQFGNWASALTAYNKGPGAYKKNPAISGYAQKVLLKSHFVQATINQEET